MIKTSSIIIILIVLIAWLVYLFPGEAISPGDLLEKHSHLKENCSSCHDILHGPSGKKCVHCHVPKEIGTRSPNDLTSLSKKSLAFHTNLKADSCITCHREHQGRFSNSQTVQFFHQSLGLKDTQSCIECHLQPQNSIHEKASQNCAQCHNSSNWGSAEIDHSDYFRFDRDHQASCATCHPNADYREYTCYNCHEHSEQRIARKHLKEGVRDFNNCAGCHRSGDKHDVRKTKRTKISDVELIEGKGKESGARSEQISEHDRKSESHSDDREKDDEHDHKKRRGH